MKYGSYAEHCRTRNVTWYIKIGDISGRMPLNGTECVNMRCSLPLFLFTYTHVWPFDVMFLICLFSFFLFIHYFKRNTQLAMKASLPCGPLQINNLVQYIHLR